jgi:hypothetical protein
MSAEVLQLAGVTPVPKGGALLGGFMLAGKP